MSNENTYGRFAPIDEVLSDGTRRKGIFGPLVVVDIRPGEQEMYQMPAFVVYLDSRLESGVTRHELSIDTGERVHYRELKSADDLVLNIERKTGHFLTIDGHLHWIRPFCEQDGTWASYLQIPVPAEVLEKRLEFSLQDAGGFNPCDEKLYVLSVNNIEISYLVYEAIGKTWIRQDAHWLPLEDPTGMIFDDLIIRDVDSRILEIFDLGETQALSDYAEFILD
jgi:hypothetical protein